MHGIVSLLDDEHYQWVEELWAELKREFGIEGVYVTPYPHFSYQVATHYNVELLKSILQEFVTSRRAFRVRATGLGIFTGTHPVLYIPVVRSPKLTDFHESLWWQLSRTSDSIQS